MSGGQWRGLLVAAVAGTLAACEPEVCEPLANEYGDAFTCADLPALCGLPVRSTVQNRDAAVALDLVFLPEGFRRTDMDEFHRVVDALEASLLADTEGIVGRYPALFNFHRVELPSETDDVYDAHQGDTALAACFPAGRPGSLLMRERSIVVDNTRARFAAETNVPGADVAIVVLNGTYGRGSADVHTSNRQFTRVIRMNRWNSAGMLTHELGHALVGLGDEYVEFDECFVAPSWPIATGEVTRDEPNLAADPKRAPWLPLVNEVREGGGGLSCGIYRPPAVGCRMESSGQTRFCPACSAAVDAFLLSRAGFNDGPPVCEIAFDKSLSHLSADTLAVAMRAYDRQGVARVRLRWNGETLLEMLPDAEGAKDWSRRMRVDVDLTGKPRGEHRVDLECIDGAGLRSERAFGVMLTRP